MLTKVRPGFVFALVAVVIIGGFLVMLLSES